MLKGYRLILGSASERRKQFFKDLRLEFQVLVKEIDETFPEELKSFNITNYIAQKKAKAFEGSLQENEIVVTSDTLVLIEDEVLGKPKTEQEAKNMLKKLSGNMHCVITSVCIKSNYKESLFYDMTKVYFRALSEEEIDFYVENYQPYDKAGSYAIQEWIGHIGIVKIEGSYNNVVGFPTEKFYQELKNFIKND